MARSASSLTSSRGPKPMPPASLSGSVVSVARISIVAAPMVMRAPGLRSSRASRVGSAAAPKAPSRVASAAASGCRRIERDRAEQRIGAVDRLHLDQRRAAVGACAPSPRRWRPPTRWPWRVEEGALGRVGLAMDQRRTTRSPPRITRPSRASPSARLARHRADAGDGHDAERDAGDEHAKPAQAAAQVAEREAQRQRFGARSCGEVSVTSGSRLRHDAARRKWTGAEQQQAGRRSVR